MLQQEQLKCLLSYNVETGVFVWIKGKKTGKMAGYVEQTIKSSTPYRRICIDGKQYQAHDLAWLYCHGVWPKGNLDHIDRNGTNNRISNLREATCSQNKANGKLYKNSTSGVRGIHRQGNKWRVRAHKDGKKYSLGMFDSFDIAVGIQQEAHRKLYGEFTHD